MRVRAKQDDLFAEASLRQLMDLKTEIKNGFISADAKELYFLYCNQMVYVYRYEPAYKEKYEQLKDMKFTELFKAILNIEIKDKYEKTKQKI